MALFACALWLGGEVWSAFDGMVPRNVPLPGRSVRNMMENPNYQTILAVLIRNQKTGGDGSGISRVSHQYLYQQVWPYYTRSRTGSPGPEEPMKPVVHYRRRHKPAQNMSHAAFSGFMVNLRDAGLIEEGQDEKNRKEKAYRITETGDMAFRFFFDPVTSTTVRTVLEGS